MTKFTLLNKIEWTETSSLPKKAQHILEDIARNLSRTLRSDPAEQEIQLEVAHALLHMRIYQQFGDQSEHIAAAAHRLLEKIIDASPVEAKLSQIA